MPPQKYPTGLGFWKRFGNYGTYLGKVVDYDADDGLYSVTYEADEDKEDLTEEELAKWIKRYKPILPEGCGKVTLVSTTKAKTTRGEKKDTTQVEARTTRTKRKAPSTSDNDDNDVGKEEVAKEVNRKKSIEMPDGSAKEANFGTKRGRSRKVLQFLSRRPGAKEEEEDVEEKEIRTAKPTRNEAKASECDNKIIHSKNTKGGGDEEVEESQGTSNDSVAEDDDEREELKTWEDNFAKLVKFRVHFGHCHVPRLYSDSSFCDWVKNIRDGGRRTLSKDQRKQLNDIGFSWSPLHRSWQENYERLVQYQKHHGNCNVPHPYPDDAHLSRWIVRQKEKYYNLSQEQRKLLNDIGFILE